MDENKLLDPNINILDKIKRGLIPGDIFYSEVPAIEGTPKVELKTFLFVHELFKEDHAKLFLKVLEKAGWGGSLLIGVCQESTTDDMLDTKQIDFIIAGRLGRNHKKNLYREYLINRSDADYWRERYFICEITNEDESGIYAHGFWPSEIYKALRIRKYS